MERTHAGDRVELERRIDSEVFLRLSHDVRTAYRPSSMASTVSWEELASHRRHPPRLCLSTLPSWRERAYGEQTIMNLSQVTRATEFLPKLELLISPKIMIPERQEQPRHTAKPSKNGTPLYDVGGVLRSALTITHFIRRRLHDRKQ